MKDSRSLPHKIREAVQNIKDSVKMTTVGELQAVIKRADGSIEDRGIVSKRVITQAFGDQLAQHLNNATVASVGNYKYHSVGSDNTAATSAQTALVAESVAGYGATRATGTQSNPAARQYRSVATLNFTTTQTIEEHGVFNNATFGAGTMLDRSVVSPAISVNNGDSVTFTLTVTTVA